MPNPFVQSHLRYVPLFANLPIDQLALLSDAYEVRSYRANEVIFREREPALGIITLVAGQAVFLQIDENGLQRQVGALNPDQTINQDSLFQDTVQSATLYVPQTATIIKLTRQNFLTLLAHHPEIKTSLGLAPSDTSHHARIVQFKGQRENEEVMVLTRHHWWAFLRTAWLPILMMIGLWVVAVLSQNGILALLFFIVSILFPGLMLLYFYAEWRNDYVVVTDQRIVRVWRTILTFTSNISEIAIESVHEVNYQVPPYDPFARLFNYGTIQVKTAGDAGNFRFDLIPNPEKFQQVIIEDRNRYAQRQEQMHRYAIRAELENWLQSDSVVPNKPAGDNKGASATAPQPAQGGFGFLQTKILMDNGDVIYRKHLITWIQKTALPMILMLVAIIEGVLSIAFNVSLLGLPIAIVVFLIGAAIFYWVDWDWRHDYYIVSDSTITLIHQRPLFLQNERDQILMERVDNVVSESAGFWESLFNYGDVRVSLIGADEAKRFRTVPNPQEIQQDISRRLQKVKQRKSQADARQQREIIGEYLNIFNERLKDQGVVANPNQAEGQAPVYAQESTYANVPQGTATAPINQNNQASANEVPIQPLHSQDRNRPPGIPRKQVGIPQKPSLSDGVPYEPPPGTINRPPRFPRSNNQQ